MPKESRNALTGTEAGIFGNINGNDNIEVTRCSNDGEGSKVESHCETMPSDDTPKKFTMSLVSDYWDSDSDGEIVEELNINKNLLPIVSIKEEVEDVVEFEVSENVDFDIEETVETAWQNIDEDDEIMETETLNIDKDLLPVVAIKEEEEEDDEGVIEFEVSESVVSDIVVEKAWQNTDKDGDIVETACHNIDKNLLPIVSTKEEIVEFEVLVSEFEVTESETQENKNAPIDISSRSTISSEPLNEEKTENYRSTVTIDSGTDDSESDSDASSSDDSSSDESGSSSDCSTDSELEILKQSRKDDELKAIPYTKGEMLLSELPPIENLTISVNEDESQPIGTIFSVVNQQVVIQAFPNVPPIDLESILFLENGKRALGKVFDVFGQVHEPFYTVRFNSAEHIDESGVKIGDPVFFAPQTDHTHFVVLDALMKIKGSDASWEDNNEPPSKFVEYSDDEKESQAKQQRKQKKLGLQERIPSNEYRPQRKRFRPQGQNQNPFSDMGNRPYRGQVRFPQRRHQQPWVRPSGPNYSNRAMTPNMSVPPPGIHTGPSANMERHIDPSFSPGMSHHQNSGPYGQWSGEYQFGAPPQFPQVGPGSNWNHDNGPQSYMGPPPNHGGPSHMSHMRPHGNNSAPHPQHNYHCPPPSHPGPPNPNHGHAYSSQENWLPGPPGIYHQPPPPPPNPGMGEWNSTFQHS